MSIEAQAGIVDLLYGVTHDQGVAYQPGAVYEGSVAAFICEMRDGEARFTSAGPLESVEAAIDLLEPELRAWELSAELSTGRCALTFVYHNGSMRAPVTAGVTLMAGTARLAFETYRPLLTQTFAAYPAPPNASLRVDATVEILAFHLRKMREPDSFFSAHAYAICTFAKHAHRNNGHRAEDALNLDRGFIGHLQTLATERGGPTEQRKAVGGTRKPAMTAQERDAIFSGCKELVLRSAQFAAGCVTAQTLPKSSLQP